MDTGTECAPSLVRVFPSLQGTVTSEQPDQDERSMAREVIAVIDNDALFGTLMDDLLTDES